MTVYNIPSWTTDQFSNSLITVIKLYLQNDSVIRVILMDIEIDKVANKLGKVEVNISVTQEHLGEVERNISMVNE